MLYRNVSCFLFQEYSRLVITPCLATEVTIKMFEMFFALDIWSLDHTVGCCAKGTTAEIDLKNYHLQSFKLLLL